MTARTAAIDAAGAGAHVVGESLWIPAFAGMTAKWIQDGAVVGIIAALNLLA